MIDEKLTFKDHVAKVKGKLQYCNYIILRTRQFLTRSQLLFFYKTHVIHIVQYGVLVYGCTSYSNLDPIHKLQKRIVRSICFLCKYASVSEYMVENELPTVYELHLYELLKFISKSVRNEHFHEPFNKLLLPLNLSYNFRSVKRNAAQVPFSTTKKHEHSLSKIIPELYNRFILTSLLPNVEAIQSLNECAIKKFTSQFFSKTISLVIRIS